VDGDHLLRIGGLARRTGVRPETLRAWERRYGLLSPARTSGGLRLYSGADEQRVRRMQDHMVGGLSAAEAARLAAAGGAEPADSSRAWSAERDGARMREALERLDAAEANAALDRLLSSFPLDTVFADVVLPYLREQGERWERGALTVAEEHLATNLVRARLASLTRGWESGGGPLALLACAPGELHDLPLMIFGLALRARGWRIAYLGADTPGESVADAVRKLDPSLVVVSSVLRSRFRAAAKELTVLAGRRAVAIAGAGASESLSESLGCEWLAQGPVAAAERVATGGLAGV
jgi:DNA-binding transcriptional MerR regulator